MEDENSCSEESEDYVSLLDVGLVGYAFEPVIASGDIEISSDGESESGQESQEDNGAGAADPDPEHRLEISNGCVCRNCTFMPTVKGPACCQETNAVEYKLHGDHEDFDCITAVPRFYWICLDSENLEVAMLSMADIKAERLQRPINSR